MSQEDSGYETYVGLRRLALEAKAESLHISAAVFGAVMELSIGDAVATLVAFGNGESSLYFSNGGGMIGAGQRSKGVAEAAKSFVSVAAQLVELVPFGRGAGLPSAGMTILHILTSSGRRTTQEWETDLQEPSHELHALYVAGHNVITAYRPLMDGP